MIYKEENYCFEQWCLDWPDRTMRLRPDRTGLICKQSGPKFWDRTVVRSYGLVQSIYSRPDCVRFTKKLGPDCLQSGFLF